MIQTHSITATPSYRKEIQYQRETRDYAMHLDGELVGFARTYHEAEITLDNLVFELMSGQYFADLKPAEVQEQIDQTKADTADAEAERAAEQSTEPALLVEPEQPICDANGCIQWATHYVSDFSNPTWNGKWCCYHFENTIGAPCDCSDDDYLDALAEGTMGSYNGRTNCDPPSEPLPPADPEPWPTDSITCPGAFGPDIPCGQPAAKGGFCERCASVLERIAAEALALPSVFRPVVAPNLLAEADQVLSAPESYFVDSTPLDIARANASRIARQEQARLMQRWALARNAVDEHLAAIGQPRQTEPAFVLPAGNACDELFIRIDGQVYAISAAMVAAGLFGRQERRVAA